jgi:hypothetical protein
MAGGRPLKFKSITELKEVADSYFQDTPEEEWTITGLALALDTTRRTLIDYEYKDEFTHTIKRYKSMVENSYEKSLRKNGRAGDIFGLKNFGWADKTEIEAKVENVTPILGGNAKQNTSDDIFDE